MCRTGESSGGNTDGHGGPWIMGYFHVHTINLDSKSYLQVAPEMALLKAYKEKKYKYIQFSLGYRLHFTSPVFSLDGISGEEKRTVHQCMAF